MIQLLSPVWHINHFYLHCSYNLVICMLKHTVQLSLQYLELIATPTESQLEASFWLWQEHMSLTLWLAFLLDSQISNENKKCKQTAIERLITVSHLLEILPSRDCWVFQLFVLWAYRKSPDDGEFVRERQIALSPKVKRRPS